MYTPRRSQRYEYAHEVIFDIEERQCTTCVFAKDDEDEPMCDEIAIDIVLERPVQDLDEQDDGSVVCTKYERHQPKENHVQP